MCLRSVQCTLFCIFKISQEVHKYMAKKGKKKEAIMRQIMLMLISGQKSMAQKTAETPKETRPLVTKRF